MISELILIICTVLVVVEAFIQPITIEKNHFVNSVTNEPVSLLEEQKTRSKLTFIL